MMSPVEVRNFCLAVTAQRSNMPAKHEISRATPLALLPAYGERDEAGETVD
jgi:hypothetical protein